ncbi:sugar phosphate isomerase/epimerase family protein [Paenibacillus allorhizosphaerae]|uniref:Xylose isomerase-like TIM barrel domain-containing protein n=1 Tax=Paenibacillus allorhizosphaerae TaxID=2849866 RepID=A0ABN7TKW8_9BACL|nr:sugar phosphate isomerase/epimerase family protein [Paenibacillus allorhizosphaerae]CAG7644561.1 hypothetical protein PAECIP111802_03314 [Paenibacillus allorhizosphaerae]
MVQQHVNDGPERWLTGTSTGVRSALDMNDIRAAGLGAIELTWQKMNMFDPEVKARCDAKIAAARAAGLEVWSVHIPYGTDWDPSCLDPEMRKDVIAKVKAVLAFAQEWGVRRAVYHPSWEPIASEDRARRLKTCKETLSVLAEESVKYGVQLAIECLPRTCLGNSADEMEYLVGDEPALGICCDVNHLFKETPEQFIKRLGSRIVTTHISDNDGNDEKHWLPGDGVIGWRAVLDALVQAGYGGTFMYEVRNPDPRVLADNWQALNKLYRGEGGPLLKG